jgi:hypothetical protein
VLALLWLIPADALSAQPPGPPRSPPPPLARVEGGAEVRTAFCAGCTVRLDQVGRIGSLDGPDALSERAVMVLVGGDLVVSDVHARGVITRYSLTGAPLGQYSRSGEGPGELQFVRRMRVGAGDTLYVDDGAGNIHRFDGAGAFVDRIGVPVSLADFLPLGGDTVLVSSLGRTAEVAGYPLHIFDRAGVLASLGGEHLLTRQRELALRRVLADRGEGGVWAAHVMDYVLEGWTLDGHRTTFMTRRPSWFLFWAGIQWLASTAPPASSVSSVFEDDEGLLWVVLTVADREWERIPVEDWVSVSPTEQRSFGPEDHDRLFDTIIEVIDPSGARVIAHGRIDRHLTSMGNGFFHSYELADSGAPVYRIWRATLVRGVGDP